MEKQTPIPWSSSRSLVPALLRIGTDLKPGGHGLYQGTILVFALRRQEKSGKLSDVTPYIPAER